MMRAFFRDLYGCTADLCTFYDGHTTRLTVRDPYGTIVKRKTYSTWRGAKIAMGKMSDSWKNDLTNK